MSSFQVPRPLVDLDTLPPAIRTSEPGSFARRTLAERVPAILQDTLALNSFPPAVRAALDELHAELTGGVVRELREDAPDGAFWNAVSRQEIGRSWLDVPWYWAEAYFYRRLLEATGYFQPGAWGRRDPFAAKKTSELVAVAAPSAIAALLPRLPEDPAARFAMLLQSSLWGNRVDLSYEIAARIGRPSADRDEGGNLLIDDTPEVWEFLRTRRARRVALLADNAGTELLMDLLLVDAWLADALAEEVHLHLKPHPFFVSDAMATDVEAALAALDRTGPGAARLAMRLRGYLVSGRLRLWSHWHYATSLFYFQLPEDLREGLAAMGLVVMKGDASYRRLLGDAHWPPTTSFREATAYFPAPLVALRTLKAEIIVGLARGEAERLNAIDPSWLVDGRRGVIQARL